MAALSYMQRRKSGTYEFRRRLPEALAGKPAPDHLRDAFSDLINAKTARFKREVVRSLGTKELKDAKRRDHREALKADQRFDEALRALTVDPTQSSNPIDPKGIADEVFLELLASDETERMQGDDRRHLVTPKERAKHFPDLVEVPPSSAFGMSLEHFAAYGGFLEQLERDYREAWARRDPKIVFPETNIALKRRGIFLDKSSQEFQAIALAVLEAHVRACELLLKRQEGEVVPTPEVAPARLHCGPKLSEAFEIWKAGGAADGARKPGANTVVEAEQAVRYFIELHGDIAVGDITREKARQFRDATAKVPRALPAKLKKLPLPKLLEKDLTQFEPRKAATVHKFLQILGAVVSKAEKEGYLDELSGFVNPFGKGIRYSLEQREASRTLFEKAELKAIFNSPIYCDGLRPQGGGREAAFWFPLIGLLSGLRLDEIAQLRICDLRQDEESGRWFFDVDRNGGRSTKTFSSIRHVPVHRELDRIGLLAYRQRLIDDGARLEDGLWPDVKAKGQRPRSAAWSKWFGRYLRERCGITDSAKVFHSFRHTFKRMTRDAGLLEEQHDALTGHSGSRNVGRSYGKGLSLTPLIKAMDKVSAPTDLGHLTGPK